MKESLIGARSAILALLSTVLALSLSTPTHAAGDGSDAPARAAVPDGTITLDVVAANGSGCPAGTATVVGNADKTGFKIKYSDFVAEAGGGADATARRKNCQLGVLVSVPAGWTFAIAAADYRGRARIGAGATGLQRTNYYWQGSSEENRSEQTFTGPFNSYWGTEDVAPVLVYVPCNEQRVLNVNTELRVDVGTSTGRNSLSMKSSEGDVDTLFNFSWRQC